MVSKIIAFLSYFVIARSFGPEGSGKILAAVAFISLFLAIIDWNLHLLITREIAKNKSITRAYFNKSLGFKFLLSLIMIPAVYISSYFLYSGEMRTVIQILTPAIILMNLSLLCSAVFRAFEKMEYDAFQMLFRSIVYLCLVALISIFKFPVILIAWAFLTSELFTFILSYAIYRIKFSDFSENKEVYISGIFKEAFPLGLAFFFANIYFYLGTVLISKLGSTYDAGLYGMAYRMVMAIVLVPNMINFAFFPVLTKLFHKNKEKVLSLYSNGLKTQLIIALPLAFGGTILGEKVMQIFGRDFGDAGIAFKILVWILLINTWTNLSNQLIIAINRQKTTIYIAFIAMVYNVFGNITFIPKYGIFGAAVIALTTEVLIFIMNSYVIRRFLGSFTRPEIIQFIKPLSAFFIFGIFLLIFKDINVFLASGLSGIIYVLAIFLTKTVSISDIKALIPKKSVY
ncbi:MAG: flippase [Patescibacteria group bacterium]|nr:flippase [Patescibacteria group bacterium]